MKVVPFRMSHKINQLWHGLQFSKGRSIFSCKKINNLHIIVSRQGFISISCLILEWWVSAKEARLESYSPVRLCPRPTVTASVWWQILTSATPAKGSVHLHPGWQLWTGNPKRKDSQINTWSVNSTIGITVFLSDTVYYKHSFNLLSFMKYACVKFHQLSNLNTFLLDKKNHTANN